MPDLLPCPFCGVTPIVQPCQHHGFFITCENHDCLVAPETTRDYDTAEQAAEVWNTRPALVVELVA